MLQVLAYNAKKDKLYGFDYIFEDYESFKNLEPYMMKKITGNWNICFKTPFIEDAYIIIKECKSFNGNCVLYLKKDAYEIICSKHPEFQKDTKSSWNQYLGMIKNYPRQIDTKSMSELYKRCLGNLETIAKHLDFLLNTTIDKITYKDISGLIPEVEQIYPRNVIMCALVNGNKRITNSVPYTKRYLYKRWEDILSKLELNHDREFIYYSIRKFFRQLLEDKIATFKGGETKHSELARVLDSSEIMYLYTLFELSTPDMLYANLVNVEERSIDIKYYRSIYLKEEN